MTGNLITITEYKIVLPLLDSSWAISACLILKLRLRKFKVCLLVVLSIDWKHLLPQKGSLKTFWVLNFVILSIWFFFYYFISFSIHWSRLGRSQNFKEATQNFTEVFKIYDVTASIVIQRKQHHKEKNINLTFIVITDVKLAS